MKKYYRNHRQIFLDNEAVGKFVLVLKFGGEIDVPTNS
jgi:hypothetical protein